jgi:hypothetical protein
MVALTLETGEMHYETTAPAAENDDLFFDPVECGANRT